MHILLGTDMKHILFCGDQLTVERARSCQDARINSDTAQEALLGLEPAIADWHAEVRVVLVQVVLALSEPSALICALLILSTYTC